MKILIAQINTIPGDFNGNTQKIIDALQVAKSDGNIKLVVSPELGIPGYLVKDMIYEQGFVEKNLNSLAKIVKETEKIPGVTVIVGYIDLNRKGIGKPFHNMAAVIKDGVVIATYKKQLLPFYDVFDEGRYFEPGNENCIIDVEGTKFGIAICEDAWNDKGTDNYHYKRHPLVGYSRAGVRNFVVINSSPYEYLKPDVRLSMLQRISRSYNGYIVYANQVGGQDELVFDGHSVIIHQGNIRYIAGESEENVVFDTEDKTSATFKSVISDYQNPTVSPVFAFEKHDNYYLMFDMLVRGLRDYVRKSGFKSIVLGSSGGIDSALSCAIGCEALGPENVHAIRMPSNISSRGSIDDALKLHQNLGCRDYCIPIEYNQLTIDIKLGGINKTINSVADENIQARLRGMIVMYFSNAWGMLPVSTGNKSELAVGYCTLYGDMCGGFGMLSDVWKTQVYALARYYNVLRNDKLIPDAIMTKAPSAELAEDQTDEKSLLPYPILDVILKACIEEHITDFKLFVNKYPNCHCMVEDYDRIIGLVNRSEFKRRQAAPGIKLSKVAFGSGRRFPIVKR